MTSRRMTVSEAIAMGGKEMGGKVTKKKVATRSIHEEAFQRQLETNGIDGWVEEHRFSTTRKWRFDFAFVERKIAIEVEGIVIDGRGRHQTPQGYAADCEKYNDATLKGWRLLRFTPHMISTGAAIEAVKVALLKWDEETAKQE